MRKRINYLLIVIFALISVFVAFPAIATGPIPDHFYYKSKAEILDIPSSTLPQVVDVQLPQSPDIISSYTLLLDNVTKSPINYYIGSTTSEKPDIFTIQVNQPSSQNGLLLQDENSATYINFPVDSPTSQTTSIIKVSSLVGKMLTLRGFNFEYSQDSSEDFFITIFSIKPNGEKTIVVSEKVPASSKYISFPVETSQEFEINITHKQPIRMTEVKPQFVNGEDISTTTKFLRFVALAEHSYVLYFDKDSNAAYQNYATEYNLANPVGNKTVKAVLSGIAANEMYISPDSDNDSVIDSLDNCPNVVNTDQKDENMNGVGDACDDFDQDGIFNSVDNCPQLPNPYQEDKDADKIGDKCDGEESRVSEKYPWLPWLGIVVGFAVTGGVLAISLHQKPKTEVASETDISKK